MKADQPLIDGQRILQKFQGKGGWTYIDIPEVNPNPNAPFGWVKTKGQIDHHEFDQLKLMPKGNGKLFLPVRSAIRKKISKNAGDEVHLKLWIDHAEIPLPEEVKICLELQGSTTVDAYDKLSQGEKKRYLDHIYASKSESVKTNRIAKMITDLQDSNRDK